ncbi:hypothetical protein F2Q70_00006996 [Brassica cretica]|uniref:Legume lectin domain-containing protein n=1 Tax=Brassica cretica TaxID=69181 RepID=A0A8S9LXS7_BRACR|nr:hypothetical protein F2Q70_00006996 [Brassica cretica]
MATLAFLLVISFETMAAAADANSSFSFDGFAKSPSFDKNIALFGDSKLVGGGGSSIQLTGSVSRSQGRVIYMKPIKLFQGCFGRKDNASSGLGFLLKKEIVAVEFEKRLNCWINYEASSKRVEVRLSVSTALKPVDPFVSYSVDLAKLWKGKNFMVGLTSSNGNSCKPHYLHSWSFGMRHPSMRIHSQPLDPNAVSKTVKEEVKTVEVKGKKSKCVWRMLGALVLGAVCGSLGAMLALLYLWTICGNRRSMAVVPEECANDKSDIVVIKAAAVVDEQSKK